MRIIRITAAAVVLAVTGVACASAAAPTLDPEAVAIAACEVELASIMRDPDSLVIESAVAEPARDGEPGWVVSGTYRARNGFGGMNSDIYTCVTGPNGEAPGVATGEMLDD